MLLGRRVRWKMGRLILLWLSFLPFLRAQRPSAMMQQGMYETQDSFGETINVFNLTTISPIEETATKVSAETIETILGALDNAANGLEWAQVSTLDAHDFTTQKLPSEEDYENMGAFTVIPDTGLGAGMVEGDYPDLPLGGGGDGSESSETNEESVPPTDPPDFLPPTDFPFFPGGLGPEGTVDGDVDTPLNPGQAIGEFLPERP